MQWCLDRGATHIHIEGLCSVHFEMRAAQGTTKPERPEKPTEKPVDERTGFTEAELYASVE